MRVRRNRIDSTGAERLTPKQTSNGKNAAAKGAMNSQRLNTVVGTGRMKATLAPDQVGQRALIAPNQTNQWHRQYRVQPASDFREPVPRADGPRFHEQPPVTAGGPTSAHSRAKVGIGSHEYSRRGPDRRGSVPKSSDGPHAPAIRRSPLAGNQALLRSMVARLDPPPGAPSQDA